MTTKILFVVLLAAVIVLLLSIYLDRVLQSFQWPVKGTITSKFGNRIHPVTGEKQFHNGIDIAASEGTPVHAPVDGTVKSIFSNSTGGNQLIISHKNGYTTGYAHLSAYKVSEGDRVKKGQVIALVGRTGRVTGAHLHFTVTDPGGNKVDPVTVLA